MTKDDVADALDEIGTLLELKGENTFRTNAYHNAARLIQQLPGDLAQMVADGKLAEVRGIGEALALKITTLVTTGNLPYLEDLRASIPAGLVKMLRLPGLGPKKVKALHDLLNIDSIEKLKAACESGEVAKQKGFGAKTQTRILEGIAYIDQVGHRVRIDLALPLGQALLEQIRTFPGVIRAELCGSLRRRKETVADLDILVSSANAQPIMDAFVKIPEVIQVLGQGPTKSSVVAGLHVHGTKVTLQADLRVVEDTQYPFALHYFTGSKEHNIRMRQRAIDRGLSLNEYALANETRSVPCKDEADIFAALDLPYIQPELREDTGEIEAGELKKLPALVADSDIRGVFHNHTTYSDGTASLEEMALAAKKLGFEYFGVGDHSQSLTIARGLPSNVVRKQWAEIDRVNAKLDGVRILKGSEVDILEDGSLDYTDELLAGFEYVVASVHSHFGMTEAEMTARVCKALSHPAVTMLGHATGRLLLKREGYKINLDEVLKVAAKHGKMIEINAQPSRLDLDWKYVKQAKAMGIPIVINPDAHSTGELALYTFGVQVARRGWLTKDDVFNTRGLADVMKELARRKQNPIV
ncbi:histidinol phosphatase : DNA polymerase IV (Family X) OS=Singulisphaera acidiphila (strain ATCC BAA-1392 / DSM 18658 / VKM B-2454 / MOB10) GN=Sinac_2234 PE=4 SV=1: HHH_8: DNA_pol_B_thumb: PHP [Gemmata massiliana]|uniref:DNA-directed DNA polymerase n=1 Tax=Gemmata massiliana TaxID=1210884 RepID=A0A6P2CPC9_9BACT|nr:DNA polymerase/3'-5' exonuclease PolX [Gemmata massiliana]VTR90753.1 histidinol phosphatase : DNA polymerase IV (Family X) OS=Singulisphaera acidiphila (strain ATCC BAA-1392 / DSM 18658 / VKM B-2454 / MOB10) GN=Sinac_2234 PE=4 SV=1: HHH_8: DNA_pol_B_thumb: PHP [Gemmata massiliana]